MYPANDLRNHPEPAARYFALHRLYNEDEDSAARISTRIELPSSELVNGLINVPEGLHPYNKWQGAHWALVQLAEIGYPYIDPRLTDLRDRVYAWLFSAHHQKSIRAVEKRTRRCASQEGNALFSSVRLNIVDERTPRLVEELLGWQWPDGGWNCDKRPEAVHSSFWETWTPLRALITWREYSGSTPRLDEAIDRACEVFLTKNLYLRQSTGEVMQPEFLRLHHPSYWKYDILVGLELMESAGKLSDPRCKQALDLLESKMLPDGGFPMEERYFQASNPAGYHYSPADWGGISKRKANPWITVRALAVLKAADRVTL
ncbi:MAG: hypothetical protein WA110_01965 [Anaerolineaceae bacterium]